jgi:hypothetical protein
LIIHRGDQNLVAVLDKANHLRGQPNFGYTFGEGQPFAKVTKIQPHFWIGPIIREGNQILVAHFERGNRLPRQPKFNHTLGHGLSFTKVTKIQLQTLNMANRYLYKGGQF